MRSAKLLRTFLDRASLPAAVLASGEFEKVPMVRAPVGGYFNHLITDDGTAAPLVA